MTASRVPRGRSLGVPKILLANLLAVLLLCEAAAAQGGGPLPGPPSGEATLRGRVVHADSGEPVVGAEIALYALTADGVPGVGRTTSNEDGRFEFSGISSDPATSYLVGARYAGVPHPGGRLAFPPGQLVADVEIRVSPVSEDPAAVGVESMRFELDRLGGALRVTQTTRLFNRGAATYAVTDPGSGAAPAATIELGPDVGELALPHGVMPEGLVRDGNTLRYYGPIHPGGGELSWSYDVAADEDGSVRFAPPVPPGVATTEVLLAENLESADPEGLEPGADTTLDGAPYRTLRALGPEFALTLQLPRARIDPDALSIEEVRLVLHADDAAIQVSETHVLQVDGDDAVRSSGPDAPLLRVPLPVATSRLRFGTSDPGLQVEPDGEGVVRVVGTAPPGESLVELAYRMPVESDTVDFSRRFDQRAKLLSIYMADTGRLLVESDRLHRRRPARTADLTYLHLEAFEIEAGETVALRVSTLPPRGGLARPMTFAILGGVALLSLFLLLSPLQAALGESSGEGELDADESPERREREALYASIRDLDHDFETGKITEDDHRVLRDDLRGRALALMRAERSGGPATESAEPESAGSESAVPGSAGGVTEPEPERCPACGEAVLTEHRFCAACGSPLIRPAREQGTGP